MPNRILRDTALDSDRLASVDEVSEVLFYRLLMLADDFGRFDGRVSVIRGRAFALRQTVTEREIERRLAQLSKAQLIHRYKVADKPYISIPRFGQRQRAEKSKFPSPDSNPLTNDGQLTDEGQTSAPVDVDVYEGGDVKAKARKTPLPKDFKISDNVKIWALQKGYSNLEAQLEFFKGRMSASGKQYIDWDQAFMNCVREDWPKLREGVSSPKVKCKSCGSENWVSISGGLCEKCR